MSRFTDALDIILIEDAATGLPVLKDGRVQWRIAQPLIYDVGVEGSGETITVPAGATTDLASIPRGLWNLLPPDGPWTKAAVVHDFLYSTRGECELNGLRYRTRAAPYSRAEADGVLREAMAVVGVSALQRMIIWSAVRLGGGRGWGT